MNLSDALSDKLDQQVLERRRRACLTVPIWTNNNVSAVTTYALYSSLNWRMAG